MACQIVRFTQGSDYSPLTVGEFFKGRVFDILDGSPFGDENIRAIQCPPTLILTGRYLERIKSKMEGDWILSVPIDRVLSPESALIAVCDEISVSGNLETDIEMTQ